MNEASENDNKNSSNPRHQTFLENERLKPDLGDFTLPEYTEKVIMYGFLMVSRFLFCIIKSCYM